MRGYTRKYDLLAGKTMCDTCCNKYPLSLCYFPEYEPYVTESTAARVRAESSGDYVDLAKAAASCFNDYCKERCEVSAAEHAAVHANALPDDASARDILACVPVYDAQAAVRSALATWVDVVCVHIAASMVYDEQHAEASAAVLPIISDIVQDAEHVGFMAQGNDPQHWCFTDLVQPLGWDSSQTGDFMPRNWTIYITGILTLLSSYPWLASWLRG